MMPKLFGASLIVTFPAKTWIAGEHAPAGTVNGPSPPGLTVKVKLPLTSPALQISR